MMYFFIKERMLEKLLLKRNSVSCDSQELKWNKKCRPLMPTLSNQKKRGIRKERIGEESTWMLSRFYPILAESSCVPRQKGIYWDLIGGNALRLKRIMEAQSGTDRGGGAGRDGGDGRGVFAVLPAGLGALNCLGGEGQLWVLLLIRLRLLRLLWLLRFRILRSRLLLHLGLPRSGVRTLGSRAGRVCNLHAIPAAASEHTYTDCGFHVPTSNDGERATPIEGVDGPQRSSRAWK